MMKKQLFSLILVVPFFLFSLIFAPVMTHAATFRSGETVSVDDNLEDLYAAGGTVVINAPVTNDLAIAGGTLNLDAPVSNSVFASGGTINVRGTIGNTLRAAGGTITVSSAVARDVLLFGGTITVDREASISGDLVVNGGQVMIQSPVTGDVYVNGGQVTIDAEIGGNVEGNVENLVLGSQAVIQGDLRYESSQRAVIRDGAVINGQEDFRRMERADRDGAKIAGLISTFSFYKLIADILGSLALIYIFYTFTRRVVERGMVEPVKKGLLGIAALILGPIIGFFLLILILPGIVMLILYGLLLLLATFISKIFLGWMIMRWWYGRNNRRYTLDWKAAVVGPLVMFLLLLIPVLGWFISFIIYLIAFGSLLTEIASWISSPDQERATPHEESPAKTNRPVRRLAKKGK